MKLKQATFHWNPTWIFVPILLFLFGCLSPSKDESSGSSPSGVASSGKPIPASGKPVDGEGYGGFIRLLDAKFTPIPNTTTSRVEITGENFNPNTPLKVLIDLSTCSNAKIVTSSHITCIVEQPQIQNIAVISVTNNHSTAFLMVRFGPPEKNVFTTGLASDSSGNHFIVGGTSGNLDGNTLVGHQDMFVSKFNSNLVRVWTKQVGVPNTTTVANAVTTDALGNIYICGSSGSLDGQPTASLASAFVTKYSSNGDKIWTRLLGTAPGNNSEALAIAVHGGSVYIAGITSETFEGVPSNSYPNSFSAKFSQTGTLEWVRQLSAQPISTAEDATGLMISNSIAVNNQGEVFVGGYAWGLINGQLTGGDLSLNAFLIKYTNAGNRQWVQVLSSNVQTIQTLSLAVDTLGNVFATGFTNAPPKGVNGIDQLPLPETEPLQGVFIAKYNGQSGALAWVKQIWPDSNFADANAIATDLNGNVYISGLSQGSLPHSVRSPDTTDAFFLKYDKDGNHKWTQHVGGTGGFTYSNGMTVDSSGSVFIAGTITLADEMDPSMPRKERDIFLLKHNPTGI